MTRPRDPDVVRALAFAAGNAVERIIAPEQAGTIATNVLGTLVLTVPLLWLRRRPLPVVLALVAGGLLNQVIATPTEDLFSAIVGLIVVGFVVARHHEGRARWIPLGTLLAALLIIEGLFGAGAVIFVCGLVLAGAAGGHLVAARAGLVAEVAERTHELEALQAMRERDAVLEERRRIARELHDVIAHTVSVMVVQSGGARRQLERDPERALAALGQVEATGQEALGELDRLFGLLGDTAGTGLDALPAVVERTRAAGLPVELEVRGEPGPLSPQADLALLRVVQEALTNTLKHGGPGATAHVLLDHRDDGAEVLVRDTGWGADGPCGEGSRRGLVGMRERMEPFGGHVDAGPAPAGGFEVRARLPLGAPQEEVAV